MRGAPEQQSQYACRIDNCYQRYIAKKPCYFPHGNKKYRRIVIFWQQRPTVSGEPDIGLHNLSRPHSENILYIITVKINNRALPPTNQSRKPMLTPQEQQRLDEQKLLDSLFHLITDQRDRAYLLDIAKRVAGRQVGAKRALLRLVAGGRAGEEEG